MGAAINKKVKAANIHLSKKQEQMETLIFHQSQEIERLTKESTDLKDQLRQLKVETKAKVNFLEKRSLWQRVINAPYVTKIDAVLNEPKVVKKELSGYQPKEDPKTLPPIKSK